MSDFIPPLIPSSPPPMPDFDDDEEDDDVEFGMGIGSGITEDLDFPVPVDVEDEKKDKILGIETRRLEINGATNNWKCEEQDSTSQDSGLCMASQSSEGMSPLPQSDDEEKCNQDNESNNVINMKHSCTVMFNPDEMSSSKNNCTTDYNNGIVHEEHKINDVIPVDTGQSEHDNEFDESTIKVEILNGGHEDESNNNESDSEFVWGSTTATDNDDLFQTLSHQYSGDDDNNDKIISNIPGEVENEDVHHSQCDNNMDGFNDKNTFSDSEGDLVFKNSVNVVVSSASVSDESSPVRKILSNSDNNLCDNSSSIKVNNDEDFDDEFGNFACVTIPNCDSVFINNSISSDCTSSIPKNDDSFKDNNVLSDQQNSESSITNNESESEFKLTNLENNICSVVNELESSEVNDNVSEISNKHDNLNSEQSSAGSSVNFDNSVSNIGHNENDDDDDDFDDFSDFTQSSALPVTSLQQTQVNKCDLSTQKVVPAESNLEEIFPKSDSEVCSDVQTNKLEAGPVWKYLCPLENSPALNFQWANSQAHNKLLAALSIDSRNILFGPHWNANIPRFAANLGTNPLQPVKAAETQSGSSASPVPPTTEETAVVPDAHFDWVSSGLTNPLDYVADKISNDLENLSGNSKSSSSTVDNLNILSNEAEVIISLLPDLNFMKKTYIEILISKG